MKYLLIFLSIFAFLNCKETNEDITITFSDLYDQYISDENGVFSLRSNYKDSSDLFDNNDIEEKTAFQMEISGSKKTYPMKCRLFKGGEKTIILICNLDGGLEKSELVTIKDSKNVQYKSYNLLLEFNVNQCGLTKASYKVPFLYSADQTINIQENQKILNLELKCESYNNEPLALENYINSGLVPLKNCQKIGKTLKCEALIEDFDKISKAKNQFLVRYYHNILGSKCFQFVPYLEINYYNINKESIYLKIEKPVYNQVWERYIFTFPTNITNLPKIKTKTFGTRMAKEISYCYLIKHNELTPLYLICSLRRDSSFNISDYEGFEQIDIHYKYNFILKPGETDATVSYNGERSDIIGNVYPSTLDFSKVDSINISMNIGNPREITNITLNEAGNYLECKDFSEMKVCKVPKSHFNGAKAGYYFIRQKTKLNGNMAHYETFGVNYVLPSQGKIISYSIFLFGLLSLILF